MAFNVSIRSKYSEGNLKCHVLSVTADAATGTITTGLATVDHFTIGIQSASTASFKLFTNVGPTGTSIAGALGASGCVNGDVFFVKAYGR